MNDAPRANSEAAARPQWGRADLLRHQAFVGGRWVDADNGAVLGVDDPATQAMLGSVPDCGAAETRRAIDAAAAAQPAWAAASAGERAAVLRRWSALLLQHQDDLAQIMTLEQGKPLEESRGEIAAAAAFFQWFAEEARRAYGDTIPAHARDLRLSVLKQPVGVCGAITPWNFPASMIARKLAPALAAGCAMIVKPSELTPFSALALAALGEEAGLPAGLLSVVTGNAQAIGAELTGNPVVRKFSFTGSTAVGRQLMAQCAGTVKRLSLELGGNAPLLVFDDADLDTAVAGALVAKFRNAGQTCVSANRLLVQAGIYRRFTEALSAAVARLPVGPGSLAGVKIGPLINARAVAKVQGLVDDAIARGARPVLGGVAHPAGPNFYTPTVLADVQPGSRLLREEIFGPVAPLQRFDTEDQAIAMANDSEFGLAAYCFSRDLGRVMRVSERLEAGMVGINQGLISTEVAPFGGIKQSGFGAEGSHYGLDEYLSRKYVCVSLPA